MADVDENQYIKLDFTLESAEERKALVERIVKEADPAKLTKKYLEILADYIVFAMDKEEKKQKKILTENRMVTVNKRETSYQGIVSKLENGEDGIYNLMSDMGKGVFLVPKIEITEKDVEEVPGLKELREEIQKIEELEKKARGKRKYLLKKQLIEMRQDQYILKNSYRKPIQLQNVTKGTTQFNFDEDITIDEKGVVESNGRLSFFNPKHVSAILCNYSKLKEDSWGNFTNDSWYIMEDMDALIEKTLKKDYPLYYDLVICKIEGESNIDIQQILKEKHGITHSVEYLSSLWRNKIPKLLAEQAQEDYLVWYYTQKEQGQWKTCSRCGKTKLAHSRFFSKNKSSKDGFYSICKKCRSQKNKK